ncbi:hypothetical protein H4S01_005723, partial [Coemansia sp. RSA 2610]
PSRAPTPARRCPARRRSRRSRSRRPPSSRSPSWPTWSWSRTFRRGCAACASTSTPSALPAWTGPAWSRCPTSSCRPRACRPWAPAARCSRSLRPCCSRSIRS